MSDLASPPDVQRLLITRSLWHEIQQSCPHDGLEAGGKALGRFFADGTAVACLNISAGPDAERRAATFRPDIPFQQACYQGLVSRYPGVRLVLDYHLHPYGPGALSATDHRAVLEMLSPHGWGLEAIVLLVLTWDGPTLRPHAFYARRLSPTELDLHPLQVDFLGTEDARVRMLLEPQPDELRAIIPRETLDEVTQRLEECPEEPVPLYGYHRLSEGLIQVLATAPVLDTYPVGRAGTAQVSETPMLERELRLTALEVGGATPQSFSAHYRHGDGVVTCTLECPRLEGELRRRNIGLVEDANLAKRHVAFIGLGSVGAPIALALARAGVGRFTLLDPDRFSAPNVARHVGDARDLGRRKDRLLRERLLACHPTATVQCLEADVCAPEDGATLESHLNDADLLVVTTDAPAANLAANRLAIGLQTRALFVGIYEGGTGGEIFAYRPEQEACYACVAAFRAALPPVPRVHRAHDYVNLRKGAELPPLNALGIDIGHTVSVSASAALGLLEEPGRLEGILTPDKPLLFVANGVPGWIFDRPFELIPASLPEAGCQVCRQVAQLEPASEAPLIWQDERDVEDMPPTVESPSRQALNEQQPATTPVPHLATGTVAPLFSPEPADDTTPPPATMSAGGDGSEIGAPLVEDLTIRDLEAPEACPPGEVARAAEDGTAPRAVPPGTALPKALTAQETEKVTTAGADDDAAKTEDSHAHLTREMTRWAPGALAVAEGGRATVPIDGELLEEAYHTDWGLPNPELDGNDAEADSVPIEDEGPEAQEPWNDAQSSEEEAGDDLPDYFEPVGKDDAGGQMAIGKDDAEGLPVGKTDAEGPPVGKDDAEGQTPVGKDAAADDEDAGFSGRGFLGLVRWFGVELRSAFQPTSPGTSRDAAHEGHGGGPTEGGPSQPGAHPPRVTRQQLGLPMDEHRPPPLPEEGAGGTQSRGLFRG